MGVRGGFWEMLKPYARLEGMEFLRDKKVAVDLSLWIVQHETAIRGAHVRKSHIRITFFRTLNLFSKTGVYPVFVVDGDPSPLKSRARINRFCRANGIALSTNLVEGVAPVKRNAAFTKCVAECVELIQLLGMPILRAKGEAEALCGQLNREGHVDACITSDSDAFLFGANCVIKSFNSNSLKPFECYNMSDIEAGLGLKRKHLIAISLLVGNDHDLHGVSGIGIDTSVRFVKCFHEDDILNKLCEFGKQGFLPQSDRKSSDLNIPSSSEDLALVKSPHCSNCGHPGSRKTHVASACDYCLAYGDEVCITKVEGFKCECHRCDKYCRIKEQKKHEKWQINVCQKLFNEKNFPNTEIMDMYLSNNHGIHNDLDVPQLTWKNLQVDALVDFLVFYLNWKPSYARQCILPILSTIFLREMASDPKDDMLLFGQYKFHSIHREKIRYKCPCYVVKWKRDMPNLSVSADNVPCEQSDALQVETCVSNELCASLDDEPDIPEVHIEEGCSFLFSDENARLVESAFPNEVSRFLREKENNSLRTTKCNQVQMSITQFYRSSKTRISSNSDEETCAKKLKPLPSEDPNNKCTQSVRRRLNFG